MITSLITSSQFRESYFLSLLVRSDSDCDINCFHSLLIAFFLLIYVTVVFKHNS